MAALWERWLEQAEGELMEDGGACSCPTTVAIGEPLTVCVFCREVERRASQLLDEYDDVKRWYGPEPEDRE